MYCITTKYAYVRCTNKEWIMRPWKVLPNAATTTTSKQQPEIIRKTLISILVITPTVIEIVSQANLSGSLSSWPFMNNSAMMTKGWHTQPLAQNRKPFLFVPTKSLQWFLKIHSIRFCFNEHTEKILLFYFRQERAPQTKLEKITLHKFAESSWGKNIQFEHMRVDQPVTIEISICLNGEIAASNL